MQKLLLLKNINDLEFACKEGLLEDKKIISFSYGVHYKLQRKGFSSIPVWDYLEDANLTKKINDYKKIIEYWNQFFLKNKYKNYKNVCLYPLITFLHEALYSSFLIRKLIENENPDEFINFSAAPETPCVEGSWECSVFDSVLEYLCQENEIKYEKIITDEKRSPKKNTLLKIQELLNYLTKYISGATFLLLWKTHLYRSKEGTALSLLTRSGRPDEVKFIDAFFDEYQKREKLAVVHTWSKSVKCIKVFCDGLLTKYNTRKWVSNELKLMKEEFFLFKSKLDSWPEILQNPFLDFQWEYLLRQTIKLKIRAERRAVKLKNIFCPSIVFVEVAPIPPTIANSIAFQNLGVKTFLIPHATIPYNQKSYYDYHDYVLAKGKYQKGVFKKYEIADSQIYSFNIKVNTPNNDQFDQKAIRRKINFTQKNVITIITRSLQEGAGIFPKGDLVNLSMKQNYHYLISCTNLTRLGPDYALIFKSHPKIDYYELYEQFRSPNIFHFRKSNLDELFYISDLVIFVGAITDALFRSDLDYRRCIVCDSGLNAEINEALTQAMMVIDDHQDLFPTVKDFFSDKLDISENDYISQTFMQSDYKKSAVV